MSGPCIAPPPPRPPDGHKYDFGRVCIVGGCSSERHTMLGAPVLAARAALRSGCGSVQLCVPEPLVNAALTLIPEAIVVGLPVRGSGRIDPEGGLARLLDFESDSVVVGPGLGTSKKAKGIVRHVLTTEGPPTVIDADGMTALAHEEDGFRACREIVLTPHLGEYGRLAERFDLPKVASTDESRRAAAETLTERTGCTVVLKGLGTVVSSPDQDTWTCGRGSNILAVPGSGDVLGGLLGGLLAAWGRRGECDVGAVTRSAVEVHAKAGARWAATVASRGMLARELADVIPAVLDEESPQ